jgi:CheY-like chemotaxis protein
MTTKAEPAEKWRILLIDDSEAILDQARAALEGAGYDVVATDKAVGASRHLSGIDLVILDFHMPGFDGKDVVESMRRTMARDAKHKRLIYLYTSDEQIAGTHRALGFDGCFTDKGNVAKLLVQVEAVFRLLRMRGIAAKIKNALDT